MPKMSDASEDLRGDVEDAMSQFAPVHDALRVIETRNRFIRERYNDKSNTQSIEEEIANIRNRISRIHGILEQLWKVGRAEGWPANEHNE